MKYPVFLRSKMFLSIQVALALTFAAAPLIALGDTVNDSNAGDKTHQAYTPKNSAMDGNGGGLFTEGNYFDLSGENSSVIIGDVNGSDNTVTLSGGTGQHVIGELRDEEGDPSGEWAEGNTVTLSAGTYGDVAGGVGTGRAGAGRSGRGNVVNISGAATITLGVWGGLAAGTGGGNAENNKVIITGGSFTESDEIYGGYATSGRADDNTVHIDVPSSTKFGDIELIIGGFAKTSASNNHVTIDGSGVFTNSTFDIGGAEALSGNASNNSVTITGGTFGATGTDSDDDLNIFGGTAHNGDATGNTANISGGSFSVAENHNVSIIGGVVWGNGNATDNVINLGGSLDLSSGAVELYGGAVIEGNGNATGNTINVGGMVVLKNAQLYGGILEGEGDGSGDAFTGNTLVFKSGWTDEVGSAKNFASIVFENGSGLSGGKANLGDGSSKTTEIRVATGDAILGATLSGVGFAKTGSGKLTLTSTGNSVGSINLEEGRLNIEGTVTASGAFSMSNGTTLGLKAGSSGSTLTTGSIVTGSSATLDILGYTSGTGKLITVTGDGSIGAGSFSQILIGGIALDSPDSLLSSARIESVEKTLQISSNGLKWNQSEDNGSLNVSTEYTLDSVLGNVGNIPKRLEKTGSGKLVLSGSNTYTGGTTISEGTLSISDDSNIGQPGDSTNILAGGTLELTGTSYSQSWELAGGKENAIEATENGTTFGGKINLPEGSAPSTLVLVARGVNATFSGGITNKDGLSLEVYTDKADVDGNTWLNTGNITLEGANSFTGYTLVGEHSRLTIADGASLVSPALHLEEGSTFIKTSGATHSLSKSGTLPNGGTLTVTNQAVYEGDLDAEGATVNFRVKDSYLSKGDAPPILKVTGDAKLVNATLTAAVTGSSSRMKIGDTLNLLEVEGTLSAEGLKTAAVSDQGLINIHLGDLIFAEKSIGGTVKTLGVDKKTKSYAEGVLGGAVALAGASDYAAGNGMSAAAQSGAAGVPTGFAGVGGGSLRYKTGSHVDMDGYNLVAGAASGSDFAAGWLTAGVFIEHGEGDYSTYNTFGANRVKGKGDTEYTGGGLLARFAFNDGLYLDGTLRFGRANNDFRSADIGTGHTAYDTSSRYYGAHAGMGKVLKLGENSVDVSAQYLWTYQKGDRTRIKGATDMELKFDDVTSNRLRLNARYNHALNPTLVFYAGGGWEKEFDGKARGKLNGRPLDTPELKGNSGFAELGLSTAPLARTPLTFDVGAQGYWGKREGVIGSIRLNYRF
jgi:autotransporter-associated beta strand protein